MKTFDAAFANTETTSSVVPLGTRRVVGFYIPSGFDGVALTFTASTTVDGTFLAVHEDAGNALSITVAASRYVTITATKASCFASLPFIKIVSGTAQSPAMSITVVTTS
jgi:hypothetical protein